MVIGNLDHALATTGGGHPGLMALLTVVGAVGVGVVVLVVLGHRYRRGDSLRIGILRWLNLTYTRLMHGVRPVADDPLPPSGPAILVANHRSGVDPLVLQANTGRVIRYLMAREYYDRPILRRLFQLVGAIPVKRDGTDLAATKRALRALAKGEVIGIFPGGGISTDPEALFDPADTPIKHGAALLALRTRTPVIAAYVSGTPPLDSVFLSLLRPSRSRVIFGDPIVFEKINGKPTRVQLERATERMVEAIDELRRSLENEELAPTGA